MLWVHWRHRADDFTGTLHVADHDIESRIFDVLPDVTWFYPGTGDDSTLGAERPKVKEWRERGW